MTSRPAVLLCAGGTGGHLFPAEAVAHVLKARGYAVHLAVDDRASRFTADFPAEAIHEIPSATVSAKNPIAIIRALLKLWSGYRRSRNLLLELQPVAIAGFGGYPTVPPLLAAARMGMATLVHDANAVLGRANRFLASHVEQVAAGFDQISHSEGIEVTVTGNPVRPAVLEAARVPYPQRRADEPFNLLVFGGSQGASFFGEVVPAAIDALPEDVRARIALVLQARPEDVDKVSASLAGKTGSLEVAPFFADMAGRIAGAHLVIARAGASTVSELAVIGRPALLVPYPHALDHDQAGNAAAIEAAGGATVIAQSGLSPARLASEIRDAVENPKQLALIAEKAKKTGNAKAAETLADMIEQLAGCK